MARRQKKYHYIYKTTCLVTSRYYIGMHSTDDLDDGYLGSGKRLRRSIRKHGKENHKVEILEFFENRELLVEAEKTAITEDMIGDPMCMNLMGGGEGGYVSDEHYERLKKLASKWLKEKWEDETWRTKQIKLIKEYKSGDTFIPSFSGRTHSDETKKKISNSSKGNGKGKANSQYGTCWITKNGMNKKIKKEDLKTYISDGWVRGRK